MGRIRSSQSTDSSPMLDESGAEGLENRQLVSADLKDNPRTMSTETLPVFGPRNHPSVVLGHLTCSDKQQQLASNNPGMPQRYESEEEEVSEADTPSREEHYFSTTDVESDNGGSESDNNAGDRRSPTADVDDGCTKDNDSLTLRMSASLHPVDDHSRPTSVYTIKPTTDHGVLTPMPLLQSSQGSPPPPSPSMESSEPSPATSPLLQTFYTPSTPSTSCESDVHPHLRSFYSDTLSSDEDPTIEKETHFLTATPVTYFAPNSKPNLVFIPPSFVRSSDIKISRKPKRQRPGSISRQSSTGSNRSSASTKARRERMRSAKQNDRRNSRLATEELLDSLTPEPHTTSSSSVPASSEQNRDSTGSGSSCYSISGSDKNGDYEFSEKRQWHLNEHAAKNRMSYHLPRSVDRQPHPSTRGHHPTMSETAVNKLATETRAGRNGGYRKRDDHSFPLPDTIGMATSAPKPSVPNGSSPDAHPSRRRALNNTYRYSPSTHSPDSPGYTQDNSRQRTGWGGNYPPFHDEQSSQSSSSHARTRSRSISSASSSSKFSLSALDTGSVKSMMHRYKRPHHNDSTSSAGSVPGRSSPYSDRGPRGMMGTNASMSTTHLGLYAPDSADVMSPDRQTSGSRGPREPGGSPTPQSLRSGSTRWLSDTRETVSHVGNKAFTGLGSMLRKKTAPPE